MINKDFCAFILSHGRPNNVKTYNSLRRRGYTGDIYIICDDEDPTLSDYKKNFENVLIFSKNKAAECTDTIDNFNKKKIVVYARNTCFYLAKKLGYKYFIELDDDYCDFRYRHTKNGVLKDDAVFDLDSIFDALLEFLKDTPITCIALSQAGDFVGGKNSQVWKDKIRRKVMNSFICDVNRPFKFYGSLNEDVNAYVYQGNIGYLFLTIAQVSIAQTITQASNGGLTDAYLDLGTYVKSFYSVIIMPSAVKIAPMGNNDRRIHHMISWERCVPKILDKKYKKN